MVYRYVTSSDGAQIYTEAYGDPSQPALVLVAGYSLHSIVFEKQLALQNELHLVSLQQIIATTCALMRDSHFRFCTTRGVTVRPLGRLSYERLTRTTGRSSMPETPEEYESKLYADDFAAGETQ